jgi:hypothetical protein
LVVGEEFWFITSSGAGDEVKRREERSVTREEKRREVHNKRREEKRVP